MKGINWAGVIAAVIVGQIIGFLWYGYAFGEQWMALTGVTEDSANPDAMWMGAINQLIAAVGLGWLANKTSTSSLVAGATLGRLVGVFFAATTEAQNYIYAGADTGLAPINIGYLLVTYTVMGAIIAAVKLPSKSS